MFARASVPWFIVHELRVTWRTWFQRRGRKKRRITVPIPVVVALILGIATLAIGVPVANALRDTELVATPLIAFIVDAGLLLVFTLMLSQTLASAVDAFYERGDLDLLLSSPIPPTRILVVRAVAMAIQPCLLFAGLATPFVISLAVLGHPGGVGCLSDGRCNGAPVDGTRTGDRHSAVLVNWSEAHANRRPGHGGGGWSRFHHRGSIAQSVRQ